MKTTETWISPIDKLPKANSGLWLLFVCDNNIKFGTFETVRGCNWFIDNIEIRSHPERVQYWMDIPKVPVEADE